MNQCLLSSFLGWLYYILFWQFLPCTVHDLRDSLAAYKNLFDTQGRATSWKINLKDSESKKVGDNSRVVAHSSNLTTTELQTPRQTWEERRKRGDSRSPWVITAIYLQIRDGSDCVCSLLWVYHNTNRVTHMLSHTHLVMPLEQHIVLTAMTVGVSVPSRGLSKTFLGILGINTQSLTTSSWSTSAQLYAWEWCDMLSCWTLKDYLHQFRWLYLSG